ncbi:protein of unknown function [Streptomyces murinus]
MTRVAWGGRFKQLPRTGHVRWRPLDSTSFQEVAIDIQKKHPPDYSEMSGRSDRPRTSDKVGTAGKGNAKARTWKAPRKSDREKI